MAGNPPQKKHSKTPMLCISGLTTAISGSDLLRRAGQDYRIKDVSHPDIAFDVSGYARLLQEKNPQFSWETCCYVASAKQFYVRLLPFEGFVLHACAVVLDGDAYLFSADSGTGKSTHAALWLSHFGNARAYILNDDKPLLRKMEGRYMAYGAPWCGSSGLGVNKSAPVKGVAFLSQDETDWIRPLSNREALTQLLRQSSPQVRFEQMGALIALLGDFAQSVPAYVMGCTISENAVLTAHGAMAGNGRTDDCIRMA
jgi:hypothetical protein